MKRALFVLSCACSTPPPAVAIAAPLATTRTLTPVHEEAMPRGAKRLVAEEDGAWAATFPKAKTFVAFDLPDSRRVLFTWRIGAPHAVKALAEDEDYPGNHVERVDLDVRAKGESRTIAFGELAGGVEAYGLSWCRPSETRPRAFAATFSIGIPQGDDEIALVRHDDTIHVLHRQTSDGSCEETKQGPLDTCEGFEWERVADVRVAPHAEIYEIATQAEKPFDCEPE